MNQGPVEFNWAQYLNNNPDLVRAGITTEASAILHYCRHGQSEERSILNPRDESYRLEEGGRRHVIHPLDPVFKVLLEATGDWSRAWRAYLAGGRASVRILDSLLTTHHDGALTLLEFGAGFGRLTRHMTDHLAGIMVRSCDPDPHAVSFLHTVIRMEALPQGRALGQQTQYDVVFVPSLFIRVPPAKWATWLSRLLCLVRQGGVLVFVCTGGEVGPADTHGSFVRERISELETGKLIDHQAGAWPGSRDIYIVRRERK